jgi:hypothetical protein
VASAITDLVVITVAEDAQVETTSAFYGDDFVSADLQYFDEAGTSGGWDNKESRGATQLITAEFDFGYYITCGDYSDDALSELATAAKTTNKLLIADISGSSNPEAVIDSVNANVGVIDSMYVNMYWTPLLANDPLNGGKAIIGTSGMQAGMRCARNARTDSNGVAPKNFAIAGKNYPVTRTGVSQIYQPTEQELDDLAEVHVNPVIFQRYNNGGKFVFSDCLTSARTDADRKLIPVAEMSTQVDDWVARFGQECLMLPMDTAIKRMQDFLKSLFEGIEAAKWIKPSDDLGGRSFTATVQANTQRPSDRMDVSYWLHFDGTVRAIYIQQTISK